MVRTSATNRVSLATALFLVIALIGPHKVNASEVPLWRLGIGPGGLINPHYLGAEQDSSYFLPIPYFEYNGELLKADRDGVRGVLYERGDFSLGFSGSGSLPVDSEDNDARRGMEDLDFIMEPGLALQYSLHHSVDWHWRLDLPVRSAIALSDSGPEHIGWSAYPRLYNSVSLGSWSVTSTAGVLYGDREYHGYFL